MPPIIVLSCVLALTSWLGAQHARAQGKPLTGVEIEIQGSAAPSETCLTGEQLSARVAHYSSPGVVTRGVRLVLYITARDAAELHIVRGGNVVSRRSFTRLPAPCADRRDAVALSIALALERVAPSASEPPVGAAAGGVTGQPSSGRGGASGSGVDRPGDRGASGPSPERTAPAAGGGAVNEAGDRGASVPSPERTAPAAGGGAVSEAVRASVPAEPAVTTGLDERGVSGTQSAADTPAQDEPEPEGPIVLGTMPTTTSRDPRRQSASPLQIHLGGRLTLEAVPAPVWVGALGIELPLSAAVTLGLTALVSSVGESSLAGAWARASFLGLEAVGCRNMPLGVFMLQACAGATVALCEVSGRNYPRDRPEATLLWAAGLGRVTLRWPREGSFALRGLLQPHVSISRPELRVEGSSERLRSFWIGGTAGLELWLALP